MSAINKIGVVLFTLGAIGFMKDGDYFYLILGILGILFFGVEA